MSYLFKVSGRIIKGKQEGKELGFPTANIILAIKIPSGVYAGVGKVGKKKYLAAIYISPSQKILEAHLIGFNESIYGKVLNVTLNAKIREPLKFKDKQSLVKKIALDIAEIKKRLAI